MISNSRVTVSGVNSDGLTTHVFPKARAPAIFMAVSPSGMFQGPISAHTPIGS
jgi:hypothetical protein